MTPGPGKYSPSVKQTKGTISPQWSQQKQPKDQVFSKNTPGPGQYQLPSKIQEGPQYILGLKPELNPFKNKTEPGPGLYDPIKAETQLQYSIGKRLETELSAEKMTPGPGHYLDMRDKYYQSIPGSQMGKDLRKSSFLKTPAHDKPPPGQYRTFSFVEKSQAPKFGFGSSKREKDYLSSTHSYKMPPGPGQYDLKTTMGDGTAKATMPGRRADLRPKSGRDAPGAGAYNPNHNPMRRSTPNFSLGHQVRDGELAIYLNTPGAGHYHAADQLTKQRSATYRIGSEQRPKYQQYVPPTPGPGNYTLSSTLHGPKYNLGSRLDLGNKKSPGPGQYEVKDDYTAHKPHAPQFSVGLQQRVMLKELNRNPGPGIYQNKTQLSGPKFGFGSCQRMPVKNKQEPGPGSYKIPSQISNVPSYSMPGREGQYKFV